VVSGGCLAITLGHTWDMLSGEAGKGEALYDRLREYTSWFEKDFGSTLCRERTGAAINTTAGSMSYILSGRMVSRCMDHVGKAVAYLLEMIDRPLEGGGEVTELDTRLSLSGGYCAAEVLRGIREETGQGSLFLERISMAFDGGVGLSGGLCGALAGALLPMGLLWGINPRTAGFGEILAHFVHGQKNLYLKRHEAELWSVGTPFIREFKKEFGSLECRDLIGRSLASGVELAEFMPASPICAEIKDWCRRRTVQLI
jgi:Putative redox-active protein (C_GCAxxG_C_C)